MTKKMTLEEAKAFLETADYWQLSDSSFGDVEFGWEIDHRDVAIGYLSSNGKCWLNIYGSPHRRFEGDDAKGLMRVGKTKKFESNNG